MFQLNQMEGTGQGEAGLTYNNDKNNNNSTNNNNNTNNDDSNNEGDGNNINKNTNAYAYGGTGGDRKGKRDARLRPQKIKSPQNATPSDDEVTWGMFPPPGSMEEAK